MIYRHSSGRKGLQISAEFLIGRCKKLVSGHSGQHVLPGQRNIMSACNSLQGSSESGARTVISMEGNILTRIQLGYGCRSLESCKRNFLSRRNQEPLDNVVYKCFGYLGAEMSWKKNALLVSRVKNFRSWCRALYSSGTATTVRIDGAPSVEHLENSSESSDQCVLLYFLFVLLLISLCLTS